MQACPQPQVSRLSLPALPVPRGIGALRDLSGEEGSALELLEALERACVVSSERPERVGEVMRELGREDCYHEVESFARKHAAVGMDIIGASPPSNAIVYTTRALAG